MPAADDLPIACTLAPTALHERLALIGRVTQRSLLSHALEGGTLRLRYRAEARDELERIVAAERVCCAFLRFELRDAAGLVELTLSAPPLAGVEARWLFEHFLPAAADPVPPSACGCAPGACARD